MSLTPVFDLSVPYDYSLWYGCGPLLCTLHRLFGAFIPERGLSALVLTLMIVAFFGFTLYLPRKYRWIMVLILPLYTFAIAHDYLLVWVLPFYLISLVLLQRIPMLSGFVSVFATLIGIHPLLAIFLIFFTKERKAFALGAMVAAVIGFLLPFLTYSPKDYLDTLIAWYSGFRGSMPSLTNERVSDYSLIGLLRVYTPLCSGVIWLILVNFFHFLLLPCLRVIRSKNPSRLAPIYIGSALTFIGIMSGLNSPYTLAIPLTGVLIWALYSSRYPSWLLFLAMLVISLLSYGMTFAVLIAPDLLHTHALLLCTITIIVLFPIHIFQVIELWRSVGPRKRKAK